MAQQTIENKGKKFALLSDQLYKNLKNENLKTEHTQSPQLGHVMRLDESISEILANTHLPDGIKARMYSEAVADFLAARSKAPEIVYGQSSLPPIEPAYSPATTTTKLVRQESEREEMAPRPIVATGGPKYNKAAKKKEILEAIKQHGNLVSFDPQTGALILNGHKHDDTNIFHILDYISNYKLPTDDPPPGTGRFMEALGQAGLPKSIVRHNRLRNLMGHGKGKIQGGRKILSAREPVAIFKWNKLYY